MPGQSLYPFHTADVNKKSTIFRKIDIITPSGFILLSFSQADEAVIEAVIKEIADLIKSRLADVKS